MTAYSQNRLDIIIDEIMPDPSPSVGLPNYEWIELKNLSNTPINLHNWRLGDGSGISGNFPAYTLPPDSFLIICSNTALPAMSIFGPALAIPGFPSLDNEGELIYLRAPDGRSIHAVEYASHWYHDDTKKEGGWSLEMIDTRLPCMGAANWIAATNDHGGSPGKKNAGGPSLQDSKPPLLLRSYSIDSNTIVLAFDEPLDSSEAVTLPDFAIDGGIKFLHATCLPPLFTQIALKTNQALAPDFIYTVSVTHVKDCNNNPVKNATINVIKYPDNVVVAYVPVVNGTYSSAIPETRILGGSTYLMRIIDDAGTVPAKDTGVVLHSNKLDTINLNSCATSTTLYINYTVDGTPYSLTGNAATPFSPMLAGYPGSPGTNYYCTSGAIGMQFTVNGGVPGTYPHVYNLWVNNGYYQRDLSKPCTITIIRYDLNAGGYIQGTFDFYYKDTQNISHRVVGSFRVKRIT